MLVENLDVFKEAHLLTLNLYKITKKFPNEEKFGLINQIRRASVSINSNLMEGAHRKTNKEYKQFISISRGSTGELKYQLMLANDLDYISNGDYKKLKDKLNYISKMLSSLMNKLWIRNIKV